MFFSYSRFLGIWVKSWKRTECLVSRGEEFSFTLFFLYENPHNWKQLVSLMRRKNNEHAEDHFRNCLWDLPGSASIATSKFIAWRKIIFWIIMITVGSLYTFLKAWKFWSLPSLCCQMKRKMILSIMVLFKILENVLIIRCVFRGSFIGIKYAVINCWTQIIPCICVKWIIVLTLISMFDSPCSIFLKTV